MYDLGDRAADGRLGPDLDLRRRPPDADPRQGQGAHRPLGVLVRADPATSSPTTSSRPPTACPTRCAAARSRAQARDAARSSASCAATSPARAGRTTRRPAPSAGIELPAGLQRVRAAARSRSSRRRRRPRSATTTRTIDFERAAELVGDRALAERLRDVSIAALPRAPPSTRASAGSSSPTRSSSSASTPTARSCSATRCCTPDSSRFWPADGTSPAAAQPSFDKQYVRDWAAGTGWDKTPPAPRDPRRRRRAARARDYVEAYERIAGEPFDAGWSATAP